jgi:hypothetical protein
MRPSLPARALSVIALALATGCSKRQASVGSPPPASTTTSTATEGFSTITFERTPCFGTCPVYRVTVSSGSGSGSGGGTVRFVGTQNVDSMGTFTATLDAARMAALARAFDDAGYYALDSRYTDGQANCREYGTDAQRILTSITTPTRTKSIEHDLGCAGVPTRLADLYRRFDEIIEVSRWIGRR